MINIILHIGMGFDQSKLPPSLQEAVAKIEGLEGYPLGPLRDVTVNFRQTVDYQMVPHIDPPADGPNTYDIVYYTIVYYTSLYFTLL